MNYLLEMLRAEVTWSAGLIAVTLCAVASCMGYGLLAMAPAILYLALLAIASLFIPDHPGFRAAVDRRKALEARDKLRENLSARIREVPGRTSQTNKHLKAYEEMCEHLDDLAEAEVVSPVEIEKLADSTVDFLKLLLLAVTMQHRSDSSHDASLQDEIAEIDRALENTTAAPADRRRLEKARASLEASLSRRTQIPARLAALNAQLVTSAEEFDDLCHRLLTRQASSDTLFEYVAEASRRLSVEEEIVTSTDIEIDELTRVRNARRAKQRES